MMMMMSGECALCARWSGIILGFYYGILVIGLEEPIIKEIEQNQLTAMSKEWQKEDYPK